MLVVVHSCRNLFGTLDRL